MQHVARRLYIHGSKSHLIGKMVYEVMHNWLLVAYSAMARALSDVTSSRYHARATYRYHKSPTSR